MKKLTQEEYIERALLAHKGKYSYKFISYKNSTTKITVTCPIHGNWSTNPRNHLKGNGCPKCAGKTLSNSEWITRFNIVHKNRFDYSKFVYTGSFEKSIITCSKHGDFLQNPHNHVNGQQCPKCSYKEAWVNNTYYNIATAELNKDTWLQIPCDVYVIKLESDTEVFYKVGITGQELEKRFRASDTQYTMSTVYIIKLNRYAAIYLENELLKACTESKYTPSLEFKGYTECFTDIIKIKELLDDKRIKGLL